MINNNKITFFCAQLSGAGGERVVVDLANFFSEKGFEVDMVLMQDRGMFVDELCKDVSIINLSSATFFKAIFLLAKYLRKQKPHSVISISPHTHLVSLFAKVISFSFKTKLVFRVGISYTDMFKKYTSIKDRLVKIGVKYLYKHADSIISVSKGVAQDISKIAYIKKERLHVIYNPKNIEGIKKESKDAPAHPWFKNKEVPVIVTAGRLRPQKDFSTLIRSFNLVQKEIDARLVICGDGSDRKSLEKQIIALGLSEKVYLAGFVSDVHRYVAHADVFVSTSRWEGMPNSIIEALVVGTPVIATDCPYGPREVLALETDYQKVLQNGSEYTTAGILVPVGDFIEIASVMKNILSDKILRDKYKQASIIRSNDFNQERIVSEYLAILYPNG